MQLKCVLWLFDQSELRELKKNLIFAEINQNLPQLAAFISMLKTTVLKLTTVVV